MKVTTTADNFFGNRQPTPTDLTEAGRNQVEKTMEEADHELMVYDLQFIDIIDVKTLANDVESKPSTESETQELLVELIVAGGLDALALLL